MDYIDIRCKECGEIYRVPVNPTHIQQWLAGATIQSVMPYLTADERELLMTKTCGPCYDRGLGL